MTSRRWGCRRGAIAILPPRHQAACSSHPDRHDDTRPSSLYPRRACSPKLVEDDLGRSHSQVLLRSLEGRMGPIQVIRFPLGYERFRRARLINIIVLPEYRGERIGQTLVATLYRYYEEPGLRSAFYSR